MKTEEFTFTLLNRPKTHTENNIPFCGVCKQPINEPERIKIIVSIRGRQKILENYHLKCHQKIIETYLDKFNPDWRNKE